MGASSDPGSTPPPQGSALDRRDLVRLGILALVLLVVTGVVALASGGGGGDSTVAATAQKATGLVTNVTADRLVLRPLDGGKEMTFAIRPTDVRRLDVFHLQTHASQGLPTTVTYEHDGGTLYATSAVDAVPTP